MGETREGGVTPMGRVWRFVRWLALTSGTVAGVYYGAFGDVAWAGNLLRGYVVFSVLLGVLAVVTVTLVVVSTDDHGKHAEFYTAIQRRSVPAVISRTIGVGVLVALVAAGWFFTAAGWAVAMICNWIVRAFAAEGSKRALSGAEP